MLLYFLLHPLLVELQFFEDVVVALPGGFLCFFLRWINLADGLDMLGSGFVQ